MKVLFGFEKIGVIGDPVLTLGVFDGLHLAHSKIIKSAVDTARRVKGKSVALTFYPHPRGQKSIYSLKHRVRLIEELGVDICVVVKFNRAFSSESCAEFVQKVLVEKIRPSRIFVGENFRFGRNAAGDPGLLKKYGRIYGFKVKAFPGLKRAGKVISSTSIRALIERGNIAGAADLLGRNVSVFGKVISGRGIGRTLGFPTANITPHHEVLPKPGIYAARVKLGKKAFNGACYIGSRPSFLNSNKSRDPHIEVFIFDFHRDIYGSEMEVEFVKKIRQDRKFSSRQSLSDRIKKDVLLAKKILHHNISA